MVVLARDETASLIAIFADGRYEVFLSGVAVPLWTQRGHVWAPPLGESVVDVRGDGDGGFALLTGTGDVESAVWTDTTFNHNGVQTGAYAVTPRDAFATANAELAYGLDLDGDGSIGFEAVETLVETSTGTSALSVVRLAEGGLGVLDGGGLTALVTGDSAPWLPGTDETITSVHANDTGYSVLVQGGAGDDQPISEHSFSASGTIIDDGASGDGADAGQTGHPEFATFPGPDDGSGSPSQPDDAPSLLVKFAPGTTMADVMAAASAVGGARGDVVRGEGSPLNPGGVVQTINLGGGVDPDLAIEILSRLPGVEYAERNWTVSIEALSVEATSTDPYFADGNLWGMYGDDTSPTNQYGSQAADAWLTDQTGSMSSVVGVIDTGIDPTHVDLYLNIWINQEEIPSTLALVDTDGDGLITFRDLNHSDNFDYVTDHNGNGRIDARDLLADGRWADGKDTDGNGFIDDLYGWDFYNDDNDPFDDHSHGTHVAGTIGALSNGVGVVGVAWNVQIMALKFLSSSGSGDIADAVRATDYFTLESGPRSTDQHFVATNNSWGGGGYSSTMEQAIADGALADILFVASAGNGRWPRGGVDNDTNEHYPSNYDTSALAGYDAVVAVASIDSNGSLSSFSNYGDITVDLGAPGSGIWSTTPGNGYASYSGTSMASPHVTGGLALTASLSPGTTAQDLRAALLDSTTYTKSLDGKTVTNGRLNVDTFVDVMDTVVVGPAVAITAITTDTGVSSSDFVTSDRSLIFSGTADVGAKVTLTLNSAALGVATADGAGVWQFDHQGTNLADGIHTLEASVTDSNNIKTTVSQNVTVDNLVPVVESIAIADTVLSVGETTSVTFTFSEAVFGFDAADVVLTGAGGGTLSTPSSADGGLNWTATFTPAADADVDPATIAVTADGYDDIAGNSGTGATSDPFNVDTVAPTVTPAVTGAVAVETGVEITGDVDATGTVDALAAGETLWVFRDGLNLGQAVPKVDGTWSFIDGDTLAAGTHQYSALVQDDVGNPGPESTVLEYTVEGGLFVYGTDGSDTLFGSDYADTISGLPDPAEGSTALGEKTIDQLWGMGGNDTFVLGDSRGAFYDDASSRPNNGKLDYAQINDFTAGDKIQLFGASADYLLEPWTAQDGTAGTGIFIDYGNGSFDSRDELIGLVAGEVSLVLDSSDFFLYV